MHTKREYFQQSEPTLRAKNVVKEDSTLRAILERSLPGSVLDSIYEDILPFGDR